MTEQPITPATLRDFLGLLMPIEELPSQSLLEGLTQEEREEVATWAGTCHLEASDNDVQAGPMPPSLRGLLPENHPYKRWRLPDHE